MKTSLHMKLAACLVLVMLSVVPFATAHADRPSSIPLLMVVMEFDGGDSGEGAIYYDDDYDWGTALFGEDDSPASFYRDMSLGSFAFVPATETSALGVGNNTNVHDQPNDGIVHVTLHQPHNAWGAVNFNADVTRDFAAAAMEALRAASDYVDFSSYDANGDGMIVSKELGVCFCVAGYEAASVSDYLRSDIPLIWAHSGSFGLLDDEVRFVDGVRVGGYIAIAERSWDEGTPLESASQEPLGVVYHELGHALGLPDLYAVRYTEGPWEDYAVGALSLMDQGGWQYADDGNGWRNIPSALDAWSRYVLGWTNPGIVVQSGDYTVSSQLSDEGYSQLIIPTDDPNQYFIVENRQPEGHDVSLDDGDTGLVVWHVDASIFKRYYNPNQVNDANHRPGVMCETLDGEIELHLYDKNDDEPDAGIPTGIVLSPEGGSGRDMILHVNYPEGDALNALNLRDDETYNRLGPKRKKLEASLWILRSIAR